MSRLLQPARQRACRRADGNDTPRPVNCPRLVMDLVPHVVNVRLASSSELEEQTLYKLGSSIRIAVNRM